MVFAEPAPQKQQKGGDAAVDRSKGFVLFPLPDHVCINYAASEASTLRKRKGRIFYADERQFEMWSGGRGRGGPGVLKKIKMEMFPRCLTLLYQSFLLESGETEGGGVGRQRGG